MGVKSKGNYRIAFCIKTDCSNRDIKCKECIRYNEYSTKTKVSEKE